MDLLLPESLAGRPAAWHMPCGGWLGRCRRARQSAVRHLPGGMAGTGRWLVTSRWPVTGVQVTGDRWPVAGHRWL